MPEVLLLEQSNQHNEINPVQQSMEIGGSYKELEENLDWLKTNESFYRQQYMILYNALDETTKQRFDLAENTYLTDNERLEIKGESPKNLVDFMTSYGGIPPEFINAIAAAEASMTELQQAESELGKLSPEKAKDVLAKLVNIEKCIDYDKVVGLVSASGDYALKHKVGLVIGLRKLIESGQNISFGQLRQIEDITEGFVKKWKLEEIVTNEDDNTVIDEPVDNAFDTVDLIISRINEANDMLNKYRTSHLFNNSSQEVLNSIHLWKSGENEDKDLTLDALWSYDKFELNKGFSSAIERYVVKRFSELPTLDYTLSTSSQEYIEFVDNAREMGPAEEALDNIEIIGDLDTLPFEFSRDELNLFLHDNIPPLALRQIKKVEFRAFRPEEDDEGTLLGQRVYSEELGGSIITLSNIRIREDFDIQKNRLRNRGETEAERFTAAAAKDRMLRTITHEFSHILHDVLPLVTLKQWDDIRLTDSTNITGYVKYMNDTDHYHRYKEDFADSMALFINRPEVLQIISSVRLGGMGDIFNKFSPVFEDIIKKKLWKRIINYKIIRLSSGLTDDDAKEYYLRHEISATD